MLQTFVGLQDMEDYSCQDHTKSGNGISDNFGPLDESVDLEGTTSGSSQFDPRHCQISASSDSDWIPPNKDEKKKKPEKEPEVVDISSDDGEAQDGRPDSPPLPLSSYYVSCFVSIFWPFFDHFKVILTCEMISIN